MNSYYYSALLIVCGAIYSFTSSQGYSSGAKPGPDNSQPTPRIAEPATTAASTELSAYPEDLRRQFLETPYRDPSGHDRLADLMLRDDIDEPRFILATVPDPATTHLTVEFDRAIDGIKDAAADEHYLLQRYWLPWAVDAPQFSDRASQEKEEGDRAEKRRHPGVLLFHNTERDESLIVFLVGESPTNGIQRQQFDSAIYLKAAFESLYSRRHRETRFQAPLYILGTSFSGSLRTLSLALDSLCLVEDNSVCFEAVSGTASDEGSIAKFNDHFKDLQNIAGEPHLKTLVHGSTTSLQTFFTYLQTHGTIKAR
jgi:hypothetical protein